jgi:CheY-like chemotaxis protein
MESHHSPSGRILVVDDDADNRETLADLLGIYGYQVITASNGKEALALLHGGERPCLILLDLRMPVMDGWEFRRRQLADPRLAGIPILVTTAVAPGTVEAESLAIDVYLPKPFDVDLLLDVIRRYCDPARAERAQKGV